MDFAVGVKELNKLIEPEDCELSPAVQAVATSVLEDIDQRYGTQSESLMPYHNAYHSLDVCRRAIRLTNILYPYYAEQYQEDMYALSVLCGVTHDYQQGAGTGLNERHSAKNGIVRMNESGDEKLADKQFQRRYRLGVMATVVAFEDSGELIQVNLRRGSRDPIKFNMAYADINGIGMEGTTRMIRDAVNLCYEMHDDPSPEELYTFLLAQAGFLRNRLREDQVLPDIAYYFPDRVEEVYAELRRAFRKNAASAYSLALRLHDHPELQRHMALGVRSMQRVPAARRIQHLIERLLRPA